MFLFPRQGCGQGAGVCLSRSLSSSERLSSPLRLVQHHQLQWRVSRADQGQCQGQINASVKGRSRSVSRADHGQCQGQIKVSVNGRSWLVSRAYQGQIKVNVKGKSRSVSMAYQGQCQGQIKVSVMGKPRSDINTVSSLVIDECVCSVVYKN